MKKSQKKRRQKGRVGTLRFIFSYSKGVMGLFTAAILAVLVHTALGFITPVVLNFTVDTVIGGQEGSTPKLFSAWLRILTEGKTQRQALLACVCVICAGALLSAGFQYLSRVGVAKGTNRFTKTLRDALYQHIQRLPYAWHGSNPTGDVIQRCTSDVDTASNFIGGRLYELVRVVLLMAAALTLMFITNALLSWICVFLVICIITYSIIFHQVIAKQFKACDEAEGELTAQVQENLTCVRVVRAFGQEKKEWEKFRVKNNKFCDKWIDMGYTLGLFWGIGDLATQLQLVAVVCVGSLLVVRGKLSLGGLLAFVSYTHTLSWPVRQLGRTVSELSKTGVSVKRLQEILDTPVEELGNSEKRVSGDIVFDHVSFGYGESPVLKDLSFTLKKGETLGILGATGSGKSTIAYLLNRLYELPEDGGSISIGGVDVRKIDLRELRRSVGLVLQEPFLFSKTIRENLCIASPDADEAEVLRATETASVRSDVESFPKGFDTLVGERGVTLSGGQKQRVAIARTLLMECPIYVFDDSMSAVDMETDAAIREALRRDTNGATVILISHRVSTLMQADHILVLEDGHAAQFGTHRELMRENGSYRRIFELQSEAFGGETN